MKRLLILAAALLAAACTSQDAHLIYLPEQTPTPAVHTTPTPSPEPEPLNFAPIEGEGVATDLNGLPILNPQTHYFDYYLSITDLRVYEHNGETLIDAVISDDEFAGAKAIWDPAKMRHIIVSRCHPASIGFSAVPGAYRIVEDTDPFGFAVALGETGIPVRAPIAAGILTPMNIRDSRELPLGETYTVVAEKPCMIALDGEREVKLFAGDRADFIVSDDGPWRVLPRRAIARAQELGMFRGTTPLK